MTEEEELPKPVKSLALSCSWHTLAEDMSAAKYETIHKAPRAPTLKYYGETFKWKTSNKLQLRCLWHPAVSWVPDHRSARSPVRRFSQEEQQTSLVFLCFADRSYEGEKQNHKQKHPTPVMGYLRIWRWCYILARTPGSVLSCSTSLQLCAHWPDPGAWSYSSKSPFLPQMFGICSPISRRGSQEIFTLPALVPPSLWAPTSPCFSSRNLFQIHPSKLLHLLFSRSTDSALHAPWVGFCLLPVLSSEYQTRAVEGLQTELHGTCRPKKWGNSAHHKESRWTWVVEPVGLWPRALPSPCDPCPGSSSEQTVARLLTWDSASAPRVGPAVLAEPCRARVVFCVAPHCPSRFIIFSAAICVSVLSYTQIWAGILHSTFGEIPYGESLMSPQLPALDVCYPCMFNPVELYMPLYSICLFFFLKTLFFLLRNKLERKYIILKYSEYFEYEVSQQSCSLVHSPLKKWLSSLTNTVSSFWRAGADWQWFKVFSVDFMRKNTFHSMTLK